MNNKFFLPAYIKGKNDEDRTISARASEGIVDRDREIIRWSAWDEGLEDFKKHPILLLSHNYAELWVARVTSIDPRKDGLFFTAKFATTPEAEEAWRLIKETDTAAFSVGFQPVESQRVRVKELEPRERASAIKAGMAELDQLKVYTKVRLLEISLVSVPACPTALLQAWKGKRLQTKSLQDAMQAWQDDLDAEQVSGLIEKGVQRAVAGADLPGLIQGALKEQVREIRNEQWREYLLKSIVDGLRTKHAADQKAEKQRQAVAALGRGDIDLDNPRQIEAYVRAKIAGLDMDEIIDKQVRLAIDKARGRVY